MAGVPSPVTEQDPEESRSGGVSYKHAAWPGDADVRAEPDFSCFWLTGRCSTPEPHQPGLLLLHSFSLFNSKAPPPRKLP